MDPQHWNRTIKDNPIAHGLDVLHSEARRNGVCDIAAIDQLSAYVLQGIRGSVLNEYDVVTIFKALAADSIEQDPLRSLLKTAIAKADDKTMWDEISTLVVTLQFEKVVIAAQSPEMVLGDRPTGSSS
ncbi:hypothetical protein E4U60_004057 [Claviceps pazoutovae]|uniref:Uncharacterized protein n=1 Tax=Claviceps pazoutovae TaxID=1649127 RepID=A0A9P7M9G3_9HYPO|nr:hypothetical protein E4U60_004057 [Claviceps pazoutovae]